ncbi:cellulase (glycosyl hydrolase family 5) [Microbacterium sp. AG1240]|nr:cellulase (glycosyl hydrolase family 5) [Microbacterium sp. AG1240]
MRVRRRYAFAAVALALAFFFVTLSVTLPSMTSGEPSPTAPEAVDDTALTTGDDAEYLAGYEYLRGVNVYSLIFTGKGVPVTALGEPQSSYDFLAERGVKIVRLAVPWQRLQEIPDGGDAIDGLNEPVDLEYLEMVAEQVSRAGAAGIRTVIDLHNGCTYPWGAGAPIEGSVLCGQGITEAHVTHIWSTIAERFRDDPNIAAYNIFNEPRFQVGVDVYMYYSQVAVDAIRSTGDTHSIWVEGMLSDERGRLASIAPWGPWITDPLGRIIYSEHFYADSQLEYIAEEETGTILTRLRTFGDWCTRWEVHCAVGEVGWAAGGPGEQFSRESADGWAALFEEFYTIADQYKLDVTYFAASGTHRFGMLLAYVPSEPGIPARSGIDTARSQAEVIERHLSKRAEE